MQCDIIGKRVVGLLGNKSPKSELVSCGLGRNSAFNAYNKRTLTQEMLTSSTSAARWIDRTRWSLYATPISQRVWSAIKTLTCSFYAFQQLSVNQQLLIVEGKVWKLGCIWKTHRIHSRIPRSYSLGLWKPLRFFRMSVQKNLGNGICAYNAWR